MVYGTNPRLDVDAQLGLDAPQVSENHETIQQSAREAIQSSAIQAKSRHVMSRRTQNGGTCTTARSTGRRRTQKSASCPLVSWDPFWQRKQRTVGTTASRICIVNIVKNIFITWTMISIMFLTSKGVIVKNIRTLRKSKAIMFLTSKVFLSKKIRTHRKSIVILFLTSKVFLSKAYA